MSDRIRRTTMSFTVSLVLILSLLAGCGGNQTSAPQTPGSPSQTPSGSSTPAASQPKTGGTVVVGIWQEPITMVWPRHATPYAMSMLVMRSLNEPLIGVTPKNDYEPRLLAEVPTTANGGLSADGKTYTVKLKPGLKWSDGQPVTMKDLVYTWKWNMDKANGSSYTIGWKEIQNIEASADGLTAKIILSQPYVGFLDNVLAHGYLIPEHYMTRVGDKVFTRQPVGTGPFKMSEWVSGSHLTVERNPHYYLQGKPYLDKIIFKLVPDRNVLLAQFKSGDIHVGINFAETQLGELRNTPSANMVLQEPATLERWLLNNNDPKDLSKPHPIFSDPKVRQAVILATDRPTMLTTVMRGAATPAVNDLMKTPFYNTNLKPYPYDPAKAKQLLDEAGWVPGPDGIRVKNGVRFSVTMSTTAGDSQREGMQAIMQQNLKDVGVEMKIQNHPPSRFFGSYATGSVFARRQWDIAGHSNGLNGLDPDMYTWWHSSQITSEKNTAGMNRSGFTTPELDQILNELNITFDQTKRRELLNRAQQIVYDGYSLMAMYNRMMINAAQRQVKDMVPNDIQAYTGFMRNVEEWWLDR